MSPVTVIWSMIAAACLVLGLVHFMVWATQRKSWADLSFTAAALGVAGLALCELVLMQSESVSTFAEWQRWGHVPAFVTLVGMATFVHFYLRPGLVWWLWLIIVWRVLVLVISLAGPVSINFREITGLAPFEMLGETVSVAVGVSNPLSRVAEASLAAFMMFVLHASIVAWRRNAPRDRQRAVVIGSTIALFLGICLVTSFLLHTGRARIPYFLSPAFLPMILAMSYELSVDLFRSAQISTALRNSMDRVQLSGDAANVGFWDYRPEEDRFWVTDKVRELFGFSASEPIRMDSWLAKVHPEDLAATAKASKTFIEGGRELQLDYRLLLPGGKVCWLSAQGRNTLAEGGHMHGIIQDVSRQRQGELERSRLREELAHAGRVGVLGQLAASLAHELNQPLGAILRNAEAAELLLAAGRPDLTLFREIVADIRRDDERASKVIQRLRELLRSHELVSEVVDMHVLVDEVVALLRTEAAVRKIRVDSTADTGSTMVRGDPVHLQQVLLNLVINAMDAVEGAGQDDGFVSIGISRQADGSMEITVADSGPGVPAGDMNRVFESFYSTKRTGMGLGLSICRTIVEAHGGRIWVDAGTAGLGAEFRFTLPALEPALAS